MNTIESINLIYRNPDVRGGRPCIVGTDLRVLDIVISKIFAERTPVQLAEDYALSMAEVYAALAFYHCNKAEIDEDIREDFKRSDVLGKSGLAKVQSSDYEDLESVSVGEAMEALDKGAFGGAVRKAVDSTTIGVLDLLEKDFE
jgi:uncharacterized protein (DUF433 family)